MKQFTRRNYLKVILGALASILLLFSIYGGELWEGGRPIRDLNYTTQIQVDVIEAEAIEIDTHLHSAEKWHGAAASASGETHIADRIGAGAAGAEAAVTQIDAGNDDWGTWTQILGSSDTPVEGGKTHFDMRKILIITTEEKSVLHILQLSFSEDAPVDDPSGDAYTEDVFVSAAASPLSLNLSLTLQVPRVTAGTKVWARLRIPNANTGTMDFYFGIHEYDQ